MKISLYLNNIDLNYPCNRKNRKQNAINITNKSMQVQRYFSQLTHIQKKPTNEYTKPTISSKKYAQC